jgi:hypothetical protein
MFVLLMKRSARTESKIEGLDQVIANLGTGYEPIVSRALRFQADMLSVDPDDIRPAQDEGYGRAQTEFSEVVATRHGMIVVEVEHEERGVVFISPTGEPAAEGGRQIKLAGIGDVAIEDDLNSLAALIAERCGVTFEEHRYRSNQFKQLMLEGLTPPPSISADEVSGARLLADPASRRAAIGIASSGGLLVTDLPKQLPEDAREHADQISSELQSTGLVTAEMVVICRRTSAQVARVPTRDALERMAEDGLKCACGRDVLTERLESALSLTHLGRKLLDGSWWLTVLLMEEFNGLGVTGDSLLVEQTIGSDEMDCFADVSGELCLFELKDKEFSLGSAYSFGAKIGIHRPSHAVVVTTAGVGNDAKEHFKKAQPLEDIDTFGRRRRSSNVQYVEGLETLRADLRSLVEGIYMSDAAEILKRALPYAAMDGDSVLRALIGSPAGEKAAVASERSEV